MVDSSPRYRAFKSDLNVTWGLLSFRADLVPPRDTSRDVSFETVCPQCHAEDPHADASKLSVRYHCDDPRHGPFTASDALKASRVGKSLRVIGTNKEVEGVRTAAADPVDDLVLTPYPAIDVETNTFAMGTAYVLAQNGRSQAFGLFLSLIDHDGHIISSDGEILTLVGEISLRGSRKLMQLRSWDGQLVLQELIRPDEIRTGFPLYGEVVDDRMVDPIRELLSREVRPFIPEDHGNVQRERLDEFVQSRLEETTSDTPVVETRSGGDALLILLQDSVAASKRPTARKARARKASPRKAS